MGIMHMVWSVLVGFVVGLVARAIMPGADHIGFIATSALGIVGSFVGGFLGSIISKPTAGQSAFHPAGFATPSTFCSTGTFARICQQGESIPFDPPINLLKSNGAPHASQIKLRRVILMRTRPPG